MGAAAGYPDLLDKRITVAETRCALFSKDTGEFEITATTALGVYIISIS